MSRIRRFLARIAPGRAPTVLVLAVALVLVPMTAPQLATAQTVDPEFEAIVQEPVLQPGTTSGLTVQLLNQAEDPENSTEAARNVRATLESNGTPITVRSGTRALNAVPADGATQATFRVSVPADVDPGTYDLNVRIRYDHGEDDRNTTNVTATVRIEDRAMFEVAGSESNVSIGDTGTITLDLENVGTEPAEDATVRLESANGAVGFDGAASTTQFAGNWSVDETKTLVFDATVADSADARRYPLRATVTYDTPEGTPAESRTLSFGVTPDPEQSFAIRSVESTLRVGEEGELRGELENTADTSVSNAVVVFEPDSQTIHPVETEVAVGDLEAGERAPFSFDVDVSESAGAGQRQFSIDVRYRDRNDEVRRSDPIDVRAAVEPKRERFAVDPLNANVSAGSDGTLTLRVTNRGDEPITDVSAQLFASSPISATDDEAFAQRLDPGESRELIFGVSAASGANPKVYPLSVDFQYDTPDGDTELSQTYRVPLRAQEPEGSSFPTMIVVGLVAVLVVLALGTFLYRRV